MTRGHENKPLMFSARTPDEPFLRPPGAPRSSKVLEALRKPMRNSSLFDGARNSVGSVKVRSITLVQVAWRTPSA